METDHDHSPEDAIALSRYHIVALVIQIAQVGSKLTEAS